MKIEVTLHDIVISEAGNDDALTVRTVRSAADIVSYIEETEGEWMREAVETAVSKATDRLSASNRLASNSREGR